MISGFGISSTGVTSAVRTAGQARTTMDTMARQIATGQRVASVKDDSAAWTRASMLASQKAQVEGRQTLVGLLRAVSLEQQAEDEAVQSLWQQVRSIILSAKQYAVGSQQRNALHAEYFGLMQSIVNFDLPSRLVSSGYGSHPGGWGIQSTSADPELAGTAIWNSVETSVSQFWTQITINGTQAINNDLRTLNDAQLDALLFHASNTANSVYPSYAQWGAVDQNHLDRIDQRATRESDRLETAIGALIDADLGKAAASRAQAETRQQLALATVRQALDAYGAYAGGLLGNVQRTQQGISA